MSQKFPADRSPLQPPLTVTYSSRPAAKQADTQPTIGEPTAAPIDEDTPGRRYPTAPVVSVATAVFRPVRSAHGVSQQSLPRPPGEILLVKRKNPPRAGEWGLPGGRLHLGEHTTVGAARELWEECRIQAAIGGIVDTFEPIIYDAAGRIEYHYVVIEFWAHFTQGEAQAGDDAAEVHWIEMENLPGLHLRADTQRIIEKAYRAWQTDKVQNR